jgi:chemotaxis protein MotA
VVTIGGGLVLALLSIVVSTVMDGNSMGALVGPSSVVLVLFGTIGVAMTGFNMDDLARIPKAAIKAYTGSPVAATAAVTVLADLADIARKEGVLALEGKLDSIEDPFVKTGVQLIVDGVDAEQIQEVLEIDIAAASERHSAMIGFFESCVGAAPTMGMVGTVIGLINMLGNLSSPEQLGIGMSLALLTTLYGVLFANFIFGPIQNKLKRLNAIEMSARDMVIDGILTVQSGASPRMLVERLETYLAPEERVGYQARLGKDGATAKAA